MSVGMTLPITSMTHGVGSDAGTRAMAALTTVVASWALGTSLRVAAKVPDGRARAAPDDEDVPAVPLAITLLVIKS